MRGILSEIVGSSAVTQNPALFSKGLVRVSQDSCFFALGSSSLAGFELVAKQWCRDSPPSFAQVIQCIFPPRLYLLELFCSSGWLEQEFQ